MNSTFLNNFVIFAFGAAVGSVVTWKLVKTKYEQIAREGIESVKEYYGRAFDSKVERVKEESVEEVEREDLDTLSERSNNSEMVKNYNDILKKSGYINYSDNAKYTKKEVDNVEKPYVIEPEEFGELDGYSTVFLSHYADDVLVDDNTDEIVEDVDVVVGDDFAEHFGDYEDDIVHIRNDAFRCDYEITKVNEKYYDEG